MSRLKIALTTLLFTFFLIQVLHLLAPIDDNRAFILVPKHVFFFIIVSLLLLHLELLDQAAVHLKVLVLQHVRVQELLQLADGVSWALRRRRGLLFLV